MNGNGKETEVSQALVMRPISTLLSHAGSRAEIREYAYRLKTSLTVIDNYKRRPMTEAEAMMLAQAALGNGLDPFTGEVQILVTEKGGAGLYYSPEGYLRKGIEQLQKEGGGNCWPEFRAIVDDQERKDLLVPQGAVAFECRLHDTPTVRTWIAGIEAMTKAGAQWSDIRAIMGERPYTSAIGWYIPGNAKADAMMPPTERAKKRAFKMALKRRFALAINDDESDGDLPEEFTGPFEKQAVAKVIDNKNAAPPTPPAPTETAEPSQTQKEFDRQRVAAGMSALFGDAA